MTYHTKQPIQDICTIVQYSTVQYSTVQHSTVRCIESLKFPANHREVRVPRDLSPASCELLTALAAGHHVTLRRAVIGPDWKAGKRERGENSRLKVAPQLCLDGATKNRDIGLQQKPPTLVDLIHQKKKFSLPYLHIYKNFYLLWTVLYFFFWRGGGVTPTTHRICIRSSSSRSF